MPLAPHEDIDEIFSVSGNERGILGKVESRINALVAI